MLAFYASSRLVLALIWLKSKWNYRRKRLNQDFSEESFLASQEWPNITIQLPIFNERNVVERLIRTCAALDYPYNKLQVQVLDDSTDETCEIVQQVIQTLPQNFPIEHVRRTVRTGFKAGAMAEALRVATGEFIVVFDADFVPEPDFVKRIIIPFFSDPKIGVVQGRWGGLNEDESLLTRLQSIALNNHFAFEQFVRCYGGLFLNFNGTCGAWRKSCIEDAGGWHSDTLAEDLDLSYRAQFKGWKILYVEDIVVPGEIPNTMDALKLQQYRWSKGGIQTFKKHIFNIWRAPISPWVKFWCSVHLSGCTIYVWMFLMSVLPVLIMPFQSGKIPRMFVFTGAIGPMVVLACSQLALRKYRNILYVPLVLCLGYGMMINSFTAVLDGLFFKGGSFVRTPKQGNQGKKSSATVKAYKEKKYPWKEIGFLCMSAYVITMGDVANPMFYLTHLFYASCYLLILYLHFFGSASEDEEVKTHQAYKPVSWKAIRSSLSRVGLQAGLLLFLFFLGSRVNARFPTINGEVAWNAVFSNPENMKSDHLLTTCQDADKPNFSSWSEGNYFMMDCRSYPSLYRTASGTKFHQYFQPVYTEDEYIMARCGDKLQFHVKNQLNKDAMEKAKALWTETSSLTSSVNPSLLVLVVDSDATTASSMKQFPITSTMLSTLDQHKVFSFNKYYSAGLYDSSSEVALTSGCGVLSKSSNGNTHFPYNAQADKTSFYEYEHSGDVTMLCSRHSEAEETKNLWLWNYYQDAGYVTAFGDEECRKKLSTVNQFITKHGARTNDHIYGTHTCERYFVPKCYGDKQLHNDTFTYIQQFWNNYQSVGRMGVFRLKTNLVSSSAESVAMLDNSLRTFLAQFLESNTDTIVALVGNPDGSPQSNSRSITSLFDVVVPSQLLQQSSSLESTLDNNKAKLISTFDLYASFASIPGSTSGESAARYENTWSYNIFESTIPNSRTCSDAKIPSNLCQ